MTRRGTSMVELLVVLAILAVMTTIAVPKLRISTRATVEQNARVLAQDLDLARTRAYGARARVRTVINDTIWQFYLDQNRDSTFAESATEQTAFGTHYRRTLEKGVIMSRGLATRLPNDPDATAPTGVRRLTFTARGITEPMGTAMFIYLTHAQDAGSVYAIEINPAANVRVWRWLNGGWQ
ncbi:MAG: prepilin-type N-terminal cleavage/methylation domain-containing protein [Gemmatimonadaceae bacterium]|nr:prepilin-type N-terminal cleavage/methylation domain-containing protein [Gemmatimonadaceae bacterium]